MSFEMTIEGQTLPEDVFSLKHARLPIVST